MVHQQKIVTMTKLALYDKHEGAADRAANDYFRHDYIYRKNLGTRLAVGFGGMIILLIYWLRVIFLDGVDVFELYIQHHVTESILFILAIMAVYSLIGTIQGTREYYLVQKRLERYQGMMRFLERVDERGRIRVADDERPNMDTRRTRHTSRRPNLGQETRPRRVPPEGGVHPQEARPRQQEARQRPPEGGAHQRPMRPGTESLVRREEHDDTLPRGVDQENRNAPMRDTPGRSSYSRDISDSEAYGGTSERPVYRRTEVSRRTEERMERPRQHGTQPLVRLKRPDETGD